MGGDSLPASCLSSSGYDAVSHPRITRRTVRPFNYLFQTKSEWFSTHIMPNSNSSGKSYIFVALAAILACSGLTLICIWPRDQRCTADWLTSMSGSRWLPNNHRRYPNGRPRDIFQSAILHFQDDGEKQNHPHSKSLLACFFVCHLL